MKKFAASGRAGFSSLPWIQGELDILRELVINNSDAETTVNELVSITGIERMPSAIYSQIKLMDKSGIPVNGALLRSFSQWHNRHYAKAAMAPSRPGEWLSDDDAGAYIKRSPDFVRKKATVDGTVRRQKGVNGVWEYSREDIEKFRPEHEEANDWELKFQAALAQRAEHTTAKPVKPPHGIAISPPRDKTKWVSQMVHEDVTPVRAMDLLNSSLGNRPISQPRVGKYTRAMINNQWGECSTGISIDWNGNLVNGHHRLYAVIASGKTIRFMMIYGVNPLSYMNEDDVNVRKAWQSLDDDFRREIAGWANCAQLVLSDSKESLSLHDLVKYREVHSTAIEWAKKHSGRRRNLFSPVYVSGALVMAYYVDPAKVDEFAQKLITGTNIKPGSAAEAAFRFLTSTRIRGRRETIVKIMRCVLAHIDNETLSFTRIYATDSTVQRVAKAQPVGSVVVAQKYKSE